MEIREREPGGDNLLRAREERRDVDVAGDSGRAGRQREVGYGDGRLASEEARVHAANRRLGRPGSDRHLARTLDRKLIIKKTSDLLNCYVGETEKAIRKMFKDAEEKKAILFLDEADSLIRDRSGASHNWEVTQVNEMLTQMENFKGIFIAATNFDGTLDTASRRRFALKVKFGYLKSEGIEKLWQAFFPGVEIPDVARSLRMLTPGDFNAAYGTLRFYDASELTADVVLQALKSEIAYKDGREGRTMGL